MRYILSLIVLFTSINYGQIIPLMDDATVAPVVDNTPPLPPTSYVAIGGTSQTQYVSTWTDPTASDLDSIRFYEGTSNDTTTMAWVASIYKGSQTYTRTGRTANTTYWSAVKAVDDSGNVSYFSNIDSATTTGGGGGDTLGTDLAPNGGSELAYTGNNEWLSAFGGTITRSTGEQVRTGTYSAKGVTAGGGTGISFNIPATATASETYWVEGYIYISTSGGQVKAIAGEGAVIISTTGSWTYFKYSFVATDDSPYINFYEYGATSPVTFYVDDVTVKERLP